MMSSETKLRYSAVLAETEATPAISDSYCHVDRETSDDEFAECSEKLNIALLDKITDVMSDAVSEWESEPEVTLDDFDSADSRWNVEGYVSVWEDLDDPHDNFSERLNSAQREVEDSIRAAADRAHLRVIVIRVD